MGSLARPSGVGSTGHPAAADVRAERVTAEVNSHVCASHLYLTAAAGKRRQVTVVAAGAALVLEGKAFGAGLAPAFSG